MGRKLLNGCVVLFAAFLGPLALILAIGGASLVFGAAGPPSDVEVNVFGPRGADVDEPFVIGVSVTNEADMVQTLDDIDINSSALTAMEVTGTTPPYARTSRQPAFQTYWFEKEIQPGETLEVTLEMVPRQAGTHPLRLGVCINTPVSCLEFETDVVVK